MPSSHVAQLNTILEMIITLNPATLLDVGVGFGKYGFLSREYLEIWDGREKYYEWKRRIDGIEAFEGYLTPVHRYIYDNIYIGNALEVIPTLTQTYDLILLIDIIEHLEYTKGRHLIDLCRRTGRHIILSTPKDIGTQKTAFENPYEEHKFQWEKRHFEEFQDRYYAFDDYSIICYLGAKAKEFSIMRRNRSLGRFLPFAVPIAKKLKGLARRKLP